MTATDALHSYARGVLGCEAEAPPDKTITILDPLRSPAFLAETLRNKGFRTIAASSAGAVASICSRVVRTRHQKR